MSLTRSTSGSVLLRRLASRHDSRQTPRASIQAVTAAAAAAAVATRPLSQLSTPSWPSQQARPLPTQPTNSPFLAHISRFHTSAPRPARRRRRFNSVPATKIGLIDDAAVDKLAKESFPGYTAEERAQLEAKYTPAQLAALAAGEAAVDARDLVLQGRLRTDAVQAGINYVDDFSQVQPVIDKRAKDPAAAANVATDVRVMSDERFAQDLFEWLASFVPADVKLDRAAVDGMTDEQLDELVAKYSPSDVDLVKYFHERPSLVHRDGQTRVTLEETGNSSLAPALPKQIAGVTHLFRQTGGADDEGLDEAGSYTDLKLQTGFKVSEIQDLTVKVLVRRIVSNQTRLGKIRSFSVVAIAGNRRGRLGLGVAKSTEFATARALAQAKAVRNMRPIPRYEQRTIYGVVEAKISGTVVQLFSRPPGFGLRVPPRIFEMARAVGIADLAAKIPRSRNPMNTVKAAYEALMKQPDPEQIAIGRGKKLIDVRKVYYGGAVY